MADFKKIYRSLELINLVPLSPDQLNLVNKPLTGNYFVEGLVGSGKTSAAVERYIHMIKAGIPAENILILVPQRTLASPYYNAILQGDFPAGGISDILTLGGLGQRLIALFWPMFARGAGFLDPKKPPSFLTLETTQYYLAHLVKPLLEEGYFESVHIDHNRIYSQIIDNLNKAAAVGLEYGSISTLLKSAWSGEESRFRVYDQAQECATRFRKFCYENNLLDFSLQLEVFTHYLWPSFLCRAYLKHRYRHLIYENIEEDVPIVHDIIQEWLPDFESALLIYDFNGGYRTFLGADPQSGYQLKDLCQESLTFKASLVTSSSIKSFGIALENCLQRRKTPPSQDARSAFAHSHFRFFPQMVEWVCQETTSLVLEKKIPPGEIAILSPFLSDSLRFSLTSRLAQLQIPTITNRPSRSLRDEPAARCLLTLAKLAHPSWKMSPNLSELRYALMQSIEGMDLVRADLLTRITYRETKPENGLTSFDLIQPEMQERITFSLGERFEELRRWILDYQEHPPLELDIFLSRFFGELLSQPGFGFHNSFDSAAISSRLIESAQKFRRVLGNNKNIEITTGEEYIRMVEEGVIAAQYLQTRGNNDNDAVLIAPAYSFLMNNRPVTYQFWLDLGSLGWWERLSQPLTHPYVLSRHWMNGNKWTDVNEYQFNQASLIRLTAGLVHRCRQKIYLVTTGVNEQGDEQRGPLLQSLQNILRQYAQMEKYHV